MGSEPVFRRLQRHTPRMLRRGFRAGEGAIDGYAEDYAFLIAGARIGQVARIVPMMMSALSTYHAGLRQVVIVGPGNRPDTLSLLRESRSVYRLFHIVVPVDPGGVQERLARIQLDRQSI